MGLTKDSQAPNTAGALPHPPVKRCCAAPKPFQSLPPGHGTFSAVLPPGELSTSALSSYPTARPPSPTLSLQTPLFTSKPSLTRHETSSAQSRPVSQFSSAVAQTDQLGLRRPVLYLPPAVGSHCPADSKARARELRRKRGPALPARGRLCSPYPPLPPPLEEWLLHAAPTAQSAQQSSCPFTK